MLSRPDLTAHEARFRVIFATAISYAAVIVGALAGPVASAGAATTIGQTFTPATECGVITFLQSFSPGNQYAAPAAGVITSWRFQAASPAPQVKLKVARANGGNDFTIVGESELQTLTANTVSSFPTRISVQAGDVLGIYNDTQNAPCGVAPAAPGYLFHFIEGDVPPGPTTTYKSSGNVTAQFPVAASLEPDCDGDGFGDESQDTDLTSCEVGLGKAQKNKRKGTAKLPVEVPRPGTLELAGKNLKPSSEEVATAGEVTLKIKAKGKKKQKLNRKGTTKVKPEVTYTPTGGVASTKSTTVKLVKK
jgi:hypothetical protein